MSSKITILSIDDEPINNEVIKNYLEEMGYNVVTLEDSSDAMLYIRKYSPSLILLDLNMPNLTGIQLLQLLKESNEFRGVPVIVLSGVASLDSVKKVLDLGAVDFISKPVRRLDLYSSIRAVLNVINLSHELKENNKKLFIANKSIENKSESLKILNEELVKYSKDLSEIVDKKSKENMLLQKNAVIGDMISGFVHNLRSPLSVISMQSDMIDKKISSIDDISLKDSISKKCLSISDAATKIDKMLKRLMSKKRQENLENLKPIDFNHFLRNELKFLLGNSKFKYIDKKLKLNNLNCKVEVNESDIAQVIYNLINNSMDAMYKQEKKKIGFFTYVDKSDVVFEITDNGPGIRKEHLDKLFDPFFTTKPSAEEAKPGEPIGTGLGLHSVKQLMEANNGTIEFKSKKGEFTTAILRFRKVESDEEL